MAKFNLFGNWYTLGQVQEDSPGWVYGLFLEQAVEEEDMWQNIMDQTEEEAHISDLQQSEIPKEHMSPGSSKDTWAASRHSQTCC